LLSIHRGKNVTQSFAKTNNLPYKENMKTCIFSQMKHGLH